MVEHKDIQNPEDYGPKQYAKFRYLLFAEETPRAMLEEICMTLAHLPTDEARQLLDEFKNSERAGEVGWLDCAIDENMFHYLSPKNEQEERDFLALKLIGEKDNIIVELMGKCDTHNYRIRMYEIELETLEQLLPQDPELEYSIAAIHDLMIIEKNHLEEAQKQIEIEEKIQQKIRESIQTERLKNLDPMDIRNFHFDGEEW